MEKYSDTSTLKARLREIALNMNNNTASVQTSVGGQQAQAPTEADSEKAVDASGGAAEAMGTAGATGAGGAGGDGAGAGEGPGFGMQMGPQDPSPMRGLEAHWPIEHD